MNSRERVAIEAECTRLINDFVWYADTSDYEKTIALFMPDCTFGYDGGTLYQGHDGLRTLFGMLAANQRKSVHITTNVLVDVIDEDNAESKAYSKIFFKDDPGAGPLAPFTIMRFDCRFSRADGNWRASQWRTRFDFRTSARV